MMTMTAVLWIFFAFIVLLAIQSWFLLFGMNLARVEKRSFNNAFLITVISLAFFIVISAVLSFIPVIGHVLGFLAGFLITGALVAKICNTSFGKGLLAAVLSWIAAVVITLLAAFFLGLGMTAAAA
jgi:hypothetical protein